MPGRFISFEGPEGSGKSTHVRALTEHLGGLGHRVLTTREPGGTPLCEILRDVLQHNAAGEAPVSRAEVLLFCASRAHLVETVIRPALARDEWVLADRFTDSTLAYQGFGRGFALDELRRLNHFATGGLVPDLTILLDVDGDGRHRRLGQRRAAGKENDRFEQEPDEFHRRLRQGYQELAAADPGRFLVLSTNRAVEDVAAAIRGEVARRFGIGAARTQPS